MKWIRRVIMAKGLIHIRLGDLTQSMGSNTEVIGHSGGSSSVFFDALFGRFGSNVTAIHLYSSPINQLLVDGARLITGEPLEFEPTHYLDLANSYNLSLNPIKFVGGVGGLMLAPITAPKYHNINTYPNQ